MKTILRSVFLNMIVLYLAIRIFPGLKYDGTLRTLFLATLALTLLNKTAKPLIKLLLLPINLITLGVFGWVANVATLFILTRLVVGFAIIGFYFEGIDYQGFVVPAMQISLLMSFFLASITISFVASLVSWLLRK